ncbi:MAG: hypothetical protein NTZ47_01865 [Bacteroidetes bacterium]|nr:hypothetical protein [Bacteroidota bacterium]
MKKLILSKRHITTFPKVRSSKFFRLLSVKGTILSAILFFFLLASCKKSISDDIPQHITSDKVERFLALPANPDPQIVRIINELKIRESKNHFLENIALESGFPKWEYAQLEGISIPIQESIKNLSQSSSTIKKLGTHPDTTVIIPLVLDSNKYVNSFLIASLSDTVKLHLVKGVDYAKYGYESGNNTITAKSIAMKIMAFDNKIFQTKKFNIKHDVLAKSLGKKIENSTFNIVFDSTSNNNLKKKFLLSTEICITYTTTTSSNYCTTPAYCSRQPTGCDNCPRYCTKTTEESGQFCYSYQSSMFSDNMGGFDSGSPASGGGDGLGWEPIYPRWNEDIDNRTGFSKARINELKSKISQNPFELIDCNTINNLNATDGNGPIFPRIASYQAPNTVINRISYIRSLAPNWKVDNFNIQSLTNAYGAAVNCDFFPVRIKKLPMGVSPKEFLEYFRKNINKFISPDVNVVFNPYRSGSFDDTRHFNNDFENSLGSLINIQMFNSGSVIISDYQNSTNPNAERHYFKFSTMETPLDLEHPVAGNREFGIYEDPNKKGEYIFYISGVDRIWDWWFIFGNLFYDGFAEADKLWIDIQKNVKFFINKGFGEAEIDPQKNIMKRPEWEYVEEYLQGKISYQELKKKLGC